MRGTLVNRAKFGYSGNAKPLHGRPPRRIQYDENLTRLAMAQEETVSIYTGGSCTENPGGAGGYGVVMLEEGRNIELSRGYRKTTNNRMEMLAVIEGLRALKTRCRVFVQSDSQYVVDSVNQGLVKVWKAKGWRRAKGRKVLNPDMWEKLLRQIKRHEVELAWVPGHSGIPGNERADVLAVKAARGKRLAVDRGYEAQLMRSG